MSVLFFQYFMLNSHTLDTIEERKGDHIMDYKIKGDSDCPIVEINLQNNETVKSKEAQWPTCLMLQLKAK